MENVTPEMSTINKWEEYQKNRCDFKAYVQAKCAFSSYQQDYRWNRWIQCNRHSNDKDM